MADSLTNAEFRVALSSINYNATNFQVFSFGIAFVLMLGLATLAGINIAIYSSDQELTDQQTVGLASFSVVIIVFVFVAFTAYMRNVGKYIFGRIRPITFDQVPKCTRKPQGSSLAFKI
jgi:hypothetical protein